MPPAKKGGTAAKKKTTAKPAANPSPTLVVEDDKGAVHFEGTAAQLKKGAPVRLPGGQGVRHYTLRAE